MRCVFVCVKDRVNEGGKGVLTPVLVSSRICLILPRAATLGTKM